MTERNKIWDENDDPTETGWYAIEYCWDSEEGSFCGTSYWNMKEWDSSLPVTRFAGPFEDENSADIWVEQNDISF